MGLFSRGGYVKPNPPRLTEVNRTRVVKRTQRDGSIAFFAQGKAFEEFGWSDICHMDGFTKVKHANKRCAEWRANRESFVTVGEEVVVEHSWA